MRSILFLTLLFSLAGPAHAGVPISLPESTQVVQDTLSSAGPAYGDTLRWYTMFSNLPGDWIRWGRVSFRSESLPTIAGLAALTGILVAVDDQTWRNSHRWYDSSKSVKDASDFFEYMGDGRPQFGLAGAFALWGFVRSDSRALRTSSQLVEAILSCGAVVQVIKHLTGRQSPYVSTEPRGKWDLFPNQIEYHKHVPAYDAFPSGHIATALTTVTVVAESYPEWKWVRPIGYPIVACIGISMANTGIHWYSDYPLGLALGYMFGMIVTHRDEPDHPSGNGDEGANFTLGPGWQNGTPSVVLSLKF